MKLDDGQKQWLAFRTDHCELLIQIAGKKNPAWQMTWSDVAMKNCETELAENRLAQLRRAVHIVGLKNQQDVAYQPKEQ
jgi:uncharacterized protein YecT (DUF1311 family)